MTCVEFKNWGTWGFFTVPLNLIPTFNQVCNLMAFSLCFVVNFGVCSDPVSLFVSFSDSLLFCSFSSMWRKILKLILY